jgi:predicted ATPase/class 3 adenylate cyclase
VTLLFTDIEGSTRLWEDAPAAMSIALARHDSILRDVIDRHHGHVFKTVGDAFCAVFSLAPDALRCAIAVQRVLGAEPWPAPATLRVRMALHSGDCEERDGDYFGPTVNRAARLEATAHGGQVVLSGSTYELVGGEVPEGVRLRSMGQHLLKDLTRPESIYQLVIDGLRDDFPALRTLDDPTAKNNLPAQSTSFIGRIDELVQLSELMAKHRLVTICGSGGTGKTRAALQIAADMVGHVNGGVWFVELGPLREAAQLAPALATILATGAAGSSIDALVGALGDTDTLIVLDNCEHLLRATSELVSELLKRSPGVRFLATSREPLGVHGESVNRLAPMTTSGDDPRLIDAVRLFEERAQLQKPEFVVDESNVETVLKLCQRLDGLPLAIELAAAKLRSLSVHDVEARLTDHLRILTGGNRSAPERQQTLRAMIDWSFDLLSEPEKLVMLELSVFAGDWSLDAAESVCDLGIESDDDVVGIVDTLVDKSLVQVRPVGSTTRYWLLESVRQYAAQGLLGVTGEPQATMNRHAQWCLHFAQRASAEFSGANQFLWLSAAEEEWQNIVRATLYLSELPDSAPDALRIMVALRTFLLNRFKNEEAGELTMNALAKVADAPGSAIHARALDVAGRCFNQSRRVAKSRDCLVEGLAIAREVHDEIGESRLMLLSAYLAFNEGNHAQALSDAERAVSLARGHGLIDLGAALRLCGAFRSEMGDDDLEQARAESFEALTIARELGDARSEIRLSEDLGLMAIQSGDLDTARVLFHDAASLVERDAAGIAKDRRLANITINMTTIALLRLDVDAVARHLGASIAHDHTWDELIPYQILFGALYASLRGEARTACLLHGASDELMRRHGMERELIESELRHSDQERLRSGMDEPSFTQLLDEGAALDEDLALAIVFELLESSGGEPSGAANS